MPRRLINERFIYRVSGIKNRSKVIAARKDDALRIVQTISENSINIEKGAFGHWRSKNWIKRLGQHGLVKINVRKGDIIEFILTGSAGNSEFYYRILETTGNTVPLLSSSQLLMNKEDNWRSITSNGLFKAKSDSTLQFEAHFEKGDISGTVKVYGLVIITKIIAK